MSPLKYIIIASAIFAGASFASIGLHISGSTAGLELGFPVYDNIGIELVVPGWTGTSLRGLYRIPLAWKVDADKVFVIAGVHSGNNFHYSVGVGFEYLMNNLKIFDNPAWLYVCPELGLGFNPMMIDLGIGFKLHLKGMRSPKVRNPEREKALAGIKAYHDEVHNGLRAYRNEIREGLKKCKE